MKLKMPVMAANILALTICLFILSSCNSVAKYDWKYWFSEYERKFVAFNGSNLEEAGTYWNMTVKNDCTITITLRGNVGAYLSGIRLYKNGGQVSGETDSRLNTITYKDLYLNKGDSLVLHAFWLKEYLANDYGFNITMWIDDGTEENQIENIM